MVRKILMPFVGFLCCDNVIAEEVPVPQTDFVVDVPQGWRSIIDCGYPPIQPCLRLQPLADNSTDATDYPRVEVRRIEMLIVPRPEPSSYIERALEVGAEYLVEGPTRTDVASFPAVQFSLLGSYLEPDCNCPADEWDIQSIEVYFEADGDLYLCELMAYEHQIPEFRDVFETIRSSIRLR
jgi:hypothetical protein